MNLSLNIEATLTVIRNIATISVLILYLKFFVKNGLTYKLLTSYIFLNVIVEVFESFFKNNNYLYHSFFVLQLILLSCIYYRLLNNNRLMLKVSVFFLLLLVSLPFFSLGVETPAQSHLILLLDVLLTYVFIILYANMYHFQKEGKKKHYYYFNRGLFIFALSTTVVTIIILSLQIMTNDEVYVSFLRSFILIFDILFQFFLIKEWLFLNKNKELLKR